MGVVGLWPFFRKMGHEAVESFQFPQVPQPSASMEPSSSPTIRIDVIASFYSSIRRIYTFHDLPTAHIILEQQLTAYGIPKSSVFYLEGPSPDVKRRTCESRETRRSCALQKAQSSIVDMESRLRDKQKLRKHHFVKLSKCISAAFYWSLDSRRAFAQHMRHMGWNVVECPAEADTTIALDCQPNDVVVSADSDMLAYDSVCTIWRPLSRGKFLIYDVADVLQHLELSRVQLTVLCVVSKNDYVCNLELLGIVTNYRIVKSLEVTGNIHY